MNKELGKTSPKAQAVRDWLNSQVKGQAQAVDLLLYALFSKGHVLLEGAPGLGKTALAMALAQSIKADFRRVQMTSDLLPSDILGSLRLNAQRSEFEFRKGPIFTHVLMADELNRASSKTQSALLEAMAEEKVTVDGVSYPLPQPFFVIATQNPQEFQGVYPLSESQIDRFSLHIEMNLPSAKHEQEIIENHIAQSNLPHAMPSSDQLLNLADLVEIQKKVKEVFVEETLLAYLQKLAASTREIEGATYGVSIRALLQWLDLSRAKAFLEGRNYLIPDDLVFLAPYALAHRVIFRESDLQSSHQRKDLVLHAVQSVAQPK